LASFLKNVIEKSGIDGLVNGVGNFVNYSSRQLRLIQSGQVGVYILMMVLSMLGILLLWINDGTIVTLLHKLF
jgi:NADH-quinone oxidoreductase subunit L